MPPKVRVTKENIIKTATELVRQSGADAINARAIAKVLGCSTQPIFSNFATMDELKTAVIQSAQELSLSQERLLTDKFCQRSRTHSRRQRQSFRPIFRFGF